MGELQAIGESLKGVWGTREHYEERKAYVLSHVDDRTEYEEFGNVYCKSCGGKKTLDLPKKNVYVKCRCDCQEREVEQARREQERREKVKFIREWNESVFPAESSGATFFNWNDGKVKLTEEYLTGIERCEKFCLNFQEVKRTGRGIWLYGDADSGKTYIAVAMAKKLQSDGVACIFTTLTRILEEIKAAYNKYSADTEMSVMEKYAVAECLIIDNFTGTDAVKRKSETFGTEKLTELISRRFEQKRPTVITARKSMKDLYVDGRISAEIIDKLQNRYVPILLTGNQRRVVQQAIEF